MLTNECYVQINTTQISKLHVVILHIEDIFIQRFATPTHGFQQSIIYGKLPNHPPPSSLFKICKQNILNISQQSATAPAWICGLIERVHLFLF